MKKKEIGKTKKIIKNVKSLKEKRISKKADAKYFQTLENNIMSEIDAVDECKQVCDSLVDMLDGVLTKVREAEIKKHLQSCTSCNDEFNLTKILMVEAKTELAKGVQTEAYFEELPTKIENRITEKQPSFCDTAQEFIVNKFMDEAIPTEIKSHLHDCPECKKAIAMTENVVSNLKKLSVPLPSEKYFEELTWKIDRQVEMLPSHRIAREEKRVSFSYVSDMFATFKTVLMHPYSAAAVSAIVALLIIGGQFFSSKDSIEEKQINLSEVINKTNLTAGIENDDGISIHATGTAISDPIEDAKLQINTTGTAKVDDRDRPKKLN